MAQDTHTQDTQDTQDKQHIAQLEKAAPAFAKHVNAVVNLNATLQTYSDRVNTVYLRIGEHVDAATGNGAKRKGYGFREFAQALRAHSVTQLGAENVKSYSVNPESLSNLANNYRTFAKPGGLLTPDGADTESHAAIQRGLVLLNLDKPTHRSRHVRTQLRKGAIKASDARRLVRNIGGLHDRKAKSEKDGSRVEWRREDAERLAALTERAQALFRLPSERKSNPRHVSREQELSAEDRVAELQREYNRRVRALQETCAEIRALVARYPEFGLSVPDSVSTHSEATE